MATTAVSEVGPGAWGLGLGVWVASKCFLSLLCLFACFASGGTKCVDIKYA